MTLIRAQTLPPGYIAQPVGGGERNGIKWELDRVYDPTGRLDRGRTYWEIRHVLADDPAPRSVAHAEVAPVGVTFAEFTRLTTPLERVERWIAARRRTSGAQPRRVRAPAESRELALE